MDLQQLGYFRSAARLQHMTRAAEERGVAQPSLSRAIQALEAELGVELFDRTGRGIRLNPSGQRFLRHVDRVFQALDDGRRELEDTMLARQEEIIVSAVALLWATGLFKAFSERHPDVRFRLYQRTPVEMIRQLARREVDLCLMTDPATDAIEWTPLVSGDLYVMVPPGHRLYGRGTVALEELRGEPTILPRAGGPVREIVDDLYRESGLLPNVVCESDDVAAMRELVTVGLGLQFIPDLRHALAWGTDPSCLRLTSPERSVQVGLAWPRGGYHSQNAQEFATFARSHFGSDAAIPPAPA